MAYIGHMFDTLDLKELREIYLHSRSEDVVNYVSSKYGVKGLITIDISLALGSVSNMLEFDIRGLEYELFNSSVQYLNVYYKMIVEIFSQMRSTDDERFNSILYLLENLNIKSMEYKEHESSKSFFLYILEKAHEFHKDPESDMNDCLPSILESIVMNESIGNDDVLGWLSIYPSVLEKYIVLYKKKMEMFNEVPKYGTTRNTNRTIMNVMLLIVRYQEIMHDYIESSYAQLDLDNLTANLMYDVIDQLVVNENPLEEDGMCSYFMDMSNNFIYKGSEHFNRLICLFWSVWLKYNENYLDDIDYYTDLFNNNTEKSVDDYTYQQDVDFYSIINQWRLEVDKGTSEGLFISLYYYTMYDTYMYGVLDRGYSDNEVVYRENLANMINDNILDYTFLSEPKEYIDNVVGNIFPTVELFKKSYNSARNIDLSSSGDVEDILSDIGLD